MKAATQLKIVLAIFVFLFAGFIMSLPWTYARYQCEEWQLMTKTETQYRFSGCWAKLEDGTWRKFNPQ